MPDRKWGEVDVVFENGMVTVTVNMDAGFVLNVAQMYVGSVKYPTNNGGNATVAPGQYPYNSGALNEVSSYQFQPVDVSGLNEVYIIVHGDVCEKATPPVLARPTGLITAKTFQAPFTNTLSMELDIPYNSDVNVEFLDLSGKKVKQANTRNVMAGKHIMRFNVGNLAADIHIVQIRTKYETVVKKVIVVK